MVGLIALFSLIALGSATNNTAARRSATSARIPSRVTLRARVLRAAPFKSRSTSLRTPGTW